MLIAPPSLQGALSAVVAGVFDCDALIVVGLPLQMSGRLYNVAAVIGGAMLNHTPGGRLAGFEAVGLLSCLFALASLWTAFRIRTVS